MLICRACGEPIPVYDQISCEVRIPWPEPGRRASTQLNSGWLCGYRCLLQWVISQRVFLEGQYPASRT